MRTTAFAIAAAIVVGFVFNLMTGVPITKNLLQAVSMVFGTATGLSICKLLLRGHVNFALMVTGLFLMMVSFGADMPRMFFAGLIAILIGFYIPPAERQHVSHG